MTIRQSYGRNGSLADVAACPRQVRFTPESGNSALALQCPLSANIELAEFICWEIFFQVAQRHASVHVYRSEIAS
jgi:hypothetical protein